MRFISGNQTCGLCGNGNFKKRFVIGIGQAFFQRSSGERTSVLFQEIEKSIDAILIELEFRSIKNFFIFQ